ncbi:MAG: DUF881 domain-containing protein [Lachnospiraceae bacterium]|jgi:uncharacterized protein YlxW (UPF0749 family)|nr:DUF881 domain-containing protein [Lachnospiraceae bacterium]
MKKTHVSIVLGLMCFILTISIFIQIKTVNDASKVVGSRLSNANSGLKDQVLKLRQKNKELHEELESHQVELESVRLQAVQNDTGDKEKEEELAYANKLLGFSELKGPGVVVTLDDNREISPNEVLNINNYLVHEMDLIEIINELYNAGADAVSINEQRVINTTEIKCDGNIVRVNGQMVGTPIKIKAIGFPERLYPALMMPGKYLTLMIDDGVVVDIQKSENVTIPKFTGVYKTNHLI